MITLNKKVQEILKKHKEGEAFFDALDYMIKGDVDIISSLLTLVDKFLNFYDSKNIGIIMSGQFGSVLKSLYTHKLQVKSKLLMNGGLRKGIDVTCYSRIDTTIPDYIFIDDSFYSGKTRDSIVRFMKDRIPDFKLLQTIVVYDGSPKRDLNVNSLYRYKDQINTDYYDLPT